MQHYFNSPVPSNEMRNNHSRIKKILRSGEGGQGNEIIFPGVYFVSDITHLKNLRRDEPELKP